MIRDYAPVPRLRVLRDLDSDEVFIGEWLPTLENGGFKFQLWDDVWIDEESAREIIRDTLYD